jgi:Protein of unknown function (DUF4127)
MALAATTVAVLGFGAAPSPAVAPRVALVPLDDRPVNLQDVQLTASLAGNELIVPPRYRLGRADSEGDADGIAAWLDALDLTGLDAVVVSTDMLAYGGWRASKRPDTTLEKALSRMQAIGRLKARRKQLHVFAFSTLLGLSLADDGHKGAWKAALLRWAELGGASSSSPEIGSIESQIPTSMLDRYRAARARNLGVVNAAIALVTSGGIDYLAVASDGEPPRGVAASERAEVTTTLAAPIEAHRAALTTGGDQIGTLLVARALGVPGRRVSIEQRPAGIAAAEPLSTAIQQASEIAGIAAGAGKTGDVTCVIYSGRDDTTASASASETVARLLSAAGRVSLADVEEAGAGASVPLVEALRQRHAFHQLAGYAAGDSRVAVAGALAAAAIARDDPASRDARELVVLHRLAVDFVYGTVVRPQALDDYLEPHHIDPAHLDLDQVQRTEKYLSEQVKPLVESLIADIGAEPRRRKAGPVALREVKDFKLRLPWGRLDEVELSFTLTAP